jgi:hypothetical protein
VSLAAVYDATLSRVELDADTLGGSATYAVVERSANELLWETVRGGVALPVTSGEAELADAEFFADVPTHYRITSFDASDVQQAQFTTQITVTLEDVWIKSVRYPMLNTRVTPADYGDVALAARAAALPISGRSLPLGVSDLPGGRDHLLVLGTGSVAEDDRLTLVLRVAKRVFVHVPTDADLGVSLLPGSMHALHGPVTKHRIGGVSAYHNFFLPLTEVAPPGPNVVATDLTIGTVINIYGSITALWAAHPTIRTLWDTVGSPDDLLTP